jgi:hypothetical protein
MKKIIIIMLVVFAGQTAFSQITNVRKWRKTEKDSLNNALLLYEDKLYLIALPILDDVYHHHPKEEYIKYLYARCALSRSDKHQDAYTYLSEVFSKNKRVDDIYYDIAKAAHYVGEFDEAATYIDTYLSDRKIKPENKTKAELLKRYIGNAKYFAASPTAAKITNLGDSINTEGEEYAPAISADESTLVYSYVGSKSQGGRMNSFSQPDPIGVYHEDIYATQRVNNYFKAGAPVTNLNTDANDAAISLSDDGRLLYIFRDDGTDNGDLYESKLTAYGYAQPTKIKGVVNSSGWEGHCSVSSDGKMLYFSSDRGGGYGGKDIYRAILQSDSTWGNITNLGDSVNTSMDEDAPFIHADGTTLYFSSNGRSSMGYYDIFRSIMNPSDSTFKKTENLGSPINTPDDDIYFVMAANGKNGYYSSGKQGGKGLKDIYLVEPNEPNFKENSPKIYLVKGTVKSDGAVAESTIIVENTTKNTIYKALYSNPVNGSYLVALPVGMAYKITYNYKSLSPQTLVIDASNVKGYTEKVNDIVFGAGAVDTSSVVVKKDPLIIPKEQNQITDDGLSNSGFVPKNKIQELTLMYVSKYGDVKADELDFFVQIGAFKNAANIVYPNLSGFGKIEKIVGDDGLTRIHIGGDFKTLKKAFNYCKKIIDAGQSDAFVTVIYKEKRTTFEELEKMGVFVAK